MAAGAGAQEFDPTQFGEVTPGLVYTIDSRPVRGRALLSGPGRFEGPLPLTVPAELQGEYWIDVTAPGYEAQRARVLFPGSGTPLEILPGSRPTGGGATARAFLWPGLANLTSGTPDPVRGLGLATAGGVGVTGLLASEFRRRDAEDATTPADTPPGDLAAETAARIEAARAEGTQSAAASARTDWALFAAAAWGASLLDTYLFQPDAAATVDLTDVSFALEPLSRGQAVLRSALVPGFGQVYARRPAAAAVAFYGVLGSLTGLLVAEHAYEESVDQLSALEDLYQDPGADPEALALVRDAIDDQVAAADDRRQIRNILAGVTGGLWVWNVLDAGIGTRPPREPPPDMGKRELGSASWFSGNLQLLLPPFGGRPGCATITLMF
jgi:Family of unknown function (DUF5683)